MSRRRTVDLTRLRMLARRAEIQYIEVDGDDFCNTVALAAPDGSVVGWVRKESLPGFEGWYFRSDPGSRVIELAEEYRAGKWRGP